MTRGMKDIRKERAAAGLCQYCGGPLDKEGPHCTKCSEMYRIWKRENRRKNHEAGKCANCGAPVEGDAWFCPSCQAQNNLRQNIRTAYRKVKGLCIHCGTPSGEYSLCQRCRDRRMERYYKKKNGGK